MGDFASGLADEPVGRDFGLAVENEGSSNACKDLADKDPCERWVDKESHTDADDAKETADGDAGSGAVGIDDVGCGECEERMHKSEEEGAEVNNEELLVVDLGEVLGDGSEGGQEDGCHELNKPKEYDNSISIGIHYILMRRYGGFHEWVREDNNKKSTTSYMSLAIMVNYLFVRRLVKGIYDCMF